MPADDDGAIIPAVESSSQISQLEQLRAELRVKYREFLKGANGVNPETGALGGKYRFVGYTAIGTAYTPGSGILFVGLDWGEDCWRDSPTGWRLENLIRSHAGCEWPKNLHHNGMRLHAATLLPETVYRSYLDRVAHRGLAAKEIWRHWRGPEAPAPDPLNTTAVTNFYKFVTIGRGNKKSERRGARDRVHRLDPPHGGPEKRLLLRQIEVLRPAHIVFQNRRLPGYFRCPEDIRKDFLALIDARREEGSPLTIWQSHHPAWPKWGTARRFVAGICKWQVERLREPDAGGR